MAAAEAEWSFREEDASATQCLRHKTTDGAELEWRVFQRLTFLNPFFNWPRPQKAENLSRDAQGVMMSAGARVVQDPSGAEDI